MPKIVKKLRVSHLYCLYFFTVSFAFFLINICFCFEDTRSLLLSSYSTAGVLIKMLACAKPGHINAEWLNCMISFREQ